MRQTLRHYWADHFWRNNAIFLTGSLLIAFLNYLYYPVLGRFMSVQDFGEVQALLSILNLAGITMTAFHIVVINISASRRNEGVTLIKQFEHLALLLALGLAGILVLFSHQLKQFFDFDSTLPIIVIGANLALSVALSFRDSFLHGRSNFVAISIAGAVGAVGKLLFSALLVIIGLRVFGAVAGILISQVVVLFYVTRKARQAGYTTSDTKLLPNFSLLRPEMKYLLSVMIVFFTITLFYNADVLVVKRFFSPEVAGQYAGISAIAKIIFFATSSFAAVLLASVSQSHPRGHNRRILHKSLALVVAVGSTVLSLFILAPELVIKIMIGERYSVYAGLLPYLGLVVLLVSVVNLYFYYLLALRHYIVVPIAAAGGIVTLTLTAVRHHTLETVIQNFLVGCVIIVILIVITEIYYRTRAR